MARLKLKYTKLHNVHNQIDMEVENADFHELDIQPKLKSGTNIKTVAGQSLLGSGNIVIQSTDSALAALGFDVFSTENDYAIGDVVIHEGILYKFTSAHSAGAWNSEEVDVTTPHDVIEDEAKALVGYYECSTAAATAAKTVTADDYNLYTGGAMKIKFANKNTSNGSVTLDINSTGDVPLYYRGAPVSATNTWEAGEVCEVYYDGTNYYANPVKSLFKTGEKVGDVSIINDLTTGGTNNVLSAETIKQMASELLNLSSEQDVETLSIESRGYGYYNKNNGSWTALVNVTSRCGTVIFPVEPGEKYYITTKIGSAGTYGYLCQWSDNGTTYVGEASAFASGTEDAVDREYVVPNNVYYIAVGSYSGTPPTIKKAVIIEEISSKSYTKEESDDKYLQKSEVYDGLDSNDATKALSAKQGKSLNDKIDENVFITNTEIEDVTSNPANTVSGYLVKYTTNLGNTIEFTESSADSYSIYNIPAGSQVKITIGDDNHAYGYSLTDTNDLVLESTRDALIGANNSYTFQIQNQPTKLYASTRYLVKVEVISTTTESLKDVVTGLNSKIEEVKEEVNIDKNYWQGKKLWWCGTSIPAGTTGRKYPEKVGELLGATNVANVAVGSSMCRANVRTGNYVGANFSNITSCLSMTNAEAEDFITNYATYQPNLTGNAPEQLNDTQKARLRAASFESRLLPYLDRTNPMPDLFVIDHGHNDFKYTMPNPQGAGNISDITLEPTVASIQSGILAADSYMISNNYERLAYFLGYLDSNNSSQGDGNALIAGIGSDNMDDFVASLNRNCYIGAINFIVTVILSRNPRARIVFISNYEYEHGASPKYAPLIIAQESISNSWAFPLCEVYKYLGFSNHIIPNSATWFNETYDAQVTEDVTVFKAYNPDGVHPHSDTTGTSIDIYAGVIASFLKTCGKPINLETE